MTDEGTWTSPVLKQGFMSQSPKCLGEEETGMERAFAAANKKEKWL